MILFSTLRDRLALALIPLPRTWRYVVQFLIAGGGAGYVALPIALFLSFKAAMIAFAFIWILMCVLLAGAITRSFSIERESFMRGVANGEIEELQDDLAHTLIQAEEILRLVSRIRKGELPVTVLGEVELGLQALVSDDD